MRLFFLIFTLASTALAGIGVTAILAAGLDGWQPIVIAAGGGAIIALPVSWIVSARIKDLS
ncbi:hypothetical protein OE810_12765 [Rhodobacteraceae bacterium XHP0102]|nr:hypothetical protein [Rhodobacteraceae bacterium XHP0102]